MQTNITTINSITIPEVETAIIALDSELNEEIALDAKHKAQREASITNPEFKVTVTDVIHSKCQATMDFVKQQVLIWAHLFNAKEFEQHVIQQCEQLQFQYDEKERILGLMEKRKNSLAPDFFKIKYGRYFIVGAIAVGLADGILAYASFRHFYPILLAAVTAFVVATAISSTHFAYTPWIKKSKTHVQKWSKIIFVLAFAFVFFYWLSNLRVAAMANTIDINVASTNIQASATLLSHWAVCIVSFGLFFCVFALSFVFWRSEEERSQHQAYKNACWELEQTKSHLQSLKTQKEALQAQARQQKIDVRLLYNYLKESVHRIKTIGYTACRGFKKVYCRFRTNIPDFFADDVEFVFDDDIHLSEPENQQLA